VKKKTFKLFRVLVWMERVYLLAFPLKMALSLTVHRPSNENESGILRIWHGAPLSVTAHTPSFTDSYIITRIQHITMTFHVSIFQLLLWANIIHSTVYIA